MVVLSLLRTNMPSIRIRTVFCGHVKYSLPSAPVPMGQIRQFSTSLIRKGGGGGDAFKITPSRYTWNQYKDQLHFYTMLGLIPGLIGVFLVNVFIGPAKLTPIPEGFTPKEWEYHKHPITRFMQRYCYNGHQQVYERNLFYFYQEEEKRKMRLLTKRVEDLMAYRGDYPNYFVRPTNLGKYFRFNKWDSEMIAENRGGVTPVRDVVTPKD